MDKAIELNRQEILMAMLQAQFGDNDYGNWKPRYVAEALETASRHGRQEIVKQILEIKKDNIRSISNALSNGVWSHNLEILKMLVDAGASPNCQTDWGTSLIAAVETGDLQIVHFLVQVGADPNIRANLNGYMNGYYSPLWSAASNGYDVIFEYLAPLINDRESINSARKELTLRINRTSREDLL